MATLSTALKGNSPLAQLKEIPASGHSMLMGEPTRVPDIVFNSAQRLNNQMKTATQVMNYASSKEMAEQGRTDMRGNVMGYSDTLG